MNAPSKINSLMRRLSGKELRDSTPTYASYDDAQAQCGEGYGSDELARIVFEKSVAFPKKNLRHGPHEWLTPALTALLIASRNRPVLNVVDMGGAFGLHQDALKAVTDVVTKWAVVESQPFVKYGREISDDHRDWFTSIDDAQNWLGGADIIFCSGVLQCVREPSATLSEVLSHGARYVLWQRMALSLTADPVITVQKSRLKDNGPGPLPDGVLDAEILYPTIYWPHQDFLDAHHEYDLVFKSGGGNSLMVAGHPVSIGDAFLFEKRAA